MQCHLPTEFSLSFFSYSNCILVRFFAGVSVRLQGCKFSRVTYCPKYYSYQSICGECGEIIEGLHTLSNKARAYISTITFPINYLFPSF